MLTWHWILSRSANQLNLNFLMYKETAKTFLLNNAFYSRISQLWICVNVLHTAKTTINYSVLFHSVLKNNGLLTETTDKYMYIYCIFSVETVTLFLVNKNIYHQICTMNSFIKTSYFYQIYYSFGNSCCYIATASFRNKLYKKS